MGTDDFEEIEPIVLTIDGVLDLHAFSPKDIKTLIPEYLEQCHALGICELRIIHGKGIGNLRRFVHALLAENPLVAEYRLAGNERGGWGATLVHLKKHHSSFCGKAGSSIE